MITVAFFFLLFSARVTTSSSLLNSTIDDQERRSIAQLDQVTFHNFLPSHHHRHQQADFFNKTLRRLTMNISSNQSSTQALTSGQNNRLLPQQLKQQRQNFNKLQKTRSMAIDMATEGGRHFRQQRIHAHRRQSKGHKKRQRQQANDFRIQQIQISKDGGHTKKRQENIGFAKDKNSGIKEPDIRDLEKRPSVLVVTKMANLKKEMCKSEPLPQRVREPGCRPKMITNRFCYGQCNSFYIPKGGMKGIAVEASLDKTAFKSCSFCRPKKIESVAVTLFCPELPQRFVRKHIQVIRQCSCSALSVK